MQANNLKKEVLLLLDGAFEYNAPGFDDEQISKVLTQAQLIVIKQIYTGKNTNTDFEGTELHRRYLEQLIKTATLSDGSITMSSNQIGTHPNGTFYDLPIDFFLAIEETAVTGENNQEVIVKPIEHDFYSKNITNPYKRPYKDLIWRMDISREISGIDGGNDFTGRTSKRTELIVANKATFPITDYRVRYLIYPSNIICDEFNENNQRHSVLDESLQYDIIREAVKILTKAVKPEEYQVALNEVKDNIN